ncbi:hypothetical protein C9374_008813 [Naegleria lovaniensis]|uniref:Guanine nucleotide-binding protein subunit beta-like protein n=1 Tax=Naegleria lovaniensis TaxID=51637 RepID=A0AA88KHE1_NAELO|nr:uncharacterized protein C9374_008813 [Naegleria lovaniensis]KAG2377728.1 hypothetical protein C9374_008813 [Naegleria lovaniensis]
MLSLTPSNNDLPKGEDDNTEQVEQMENKTSEVQEGGEVVNAMMNMVDDDLDSTTPASYLDSSTLPSSSETITQMIHVVKYNFAEGGIRARMVLKSERGEFGFTNETRQIPIYTKGVRWSPDGLCLLTNSNDNRIRLFELPQQFISNINMNLKSENMDATKSESSSSTSNVQEGTSSTTIELDESWKPCLTVREGGCINDFCWHPCMNSSLGTNCNFLTASTKQPVHMWDAFNGSLLNSFLVKDHMGDVDNIISVSYNGILSKGSKIYCGLNQRICVFDAQAGSSTSYTEIHAVEKNIIRGKTKKLNESMYATGCYNNTIGIYDQHDNVVQHIIQCEYGSGVNHLQFSSNGNYLFQSSRKDQRIVCWDLRNLFEPVKYFEFSRNADTNQKINFDLDALTQLAIAGTSDGKIKIFDLEAQGKEIAQFESDALPITMMNGTNFHPYLPYIACCTGERTYPTKYSLYESSDDEDETSESQKTASLSSQISVDFENYVALWEVSPYSYVSCASTVIE